jgi:hypothetical protein
MVVTIYRGTLAEFNTHRDLSRNSASSRAIPTRKMIRALVEDPFIPSEFGTAQGGMNAGPPLTGKKLDTALGIWGDAALTQIWAALSLTTSPTYVQREWDKWVLEQNDSFEEFVFDVVARIDNPKHSIHKLKSPLWATKGLTNRLLEPFMWHTIIVTATEWENFFNLRTDENAQLEIRIIAKMMEEAYEASTPHLLKEGEWHLPFIQEHEKTWARKNPLLAVKAVTARCARVSYLTHDKKIIDLEADYKLSDSLAKNGHMSPFEHALTPIPKAEWKTRMKMSKVAREAKHLPKHVVAQIIDRNEFAGNVRGFAQARREQVNQQVFIPQVA